MEKNSFRRYLLNKLYLKDYFQPTIVRYRRDGKTLTRTIDEYLKQAAAKAQHEGWPSPGIYMLSLWTDYDNPIREVCTYGFAGGVLLSPLAFLCKSKIVALPLFVQHLQCQYI